MTESSKELYEFVKWARPHHLTLGEVRQMKPGTTLDVVIWDRNFDERWANDNAECRQLYPPETMFAKNRHRIVYRGEFRWDIYFDFMGDEATHETFHLDVSPHSKNWIVWYPVDCEDGYMHLIGSDFHQDWKEFPDQTRVGWRGPIMLWEHLKGMPQVYVGGEFGKCYQPPPPGTKIRTDPVQVVRLIKDTTPKFTEYHIDQIIEAVEFAMELERCDPRGKEKVLAWGRKWKNKEIEDYFRRHYPNRL